MKKFLPTALVVLLAALTAFAAEIPQFKDYPVTEIYQGKNSPVKLTTPEARAFRTRLKEAALGKPNFAGHYILARWGCGAGCIMSAIIDAKSGRVFVLPFTVATIGEEVIDQLQFHLDSRLLIVNGSRDEQAENGSFYYLWDGKDIKLIHSIKK